jgi:Sec-independent protein translocase protein TatA
LSGAKKLLNSLKALGKGIEEFKDATKDVKDNIESSQRRLRIFL